jgi:hypothetical protein
MFYHLRRGSGALARGDRQQSRAGPLPGGRAAPASGIYNTHRERSSFRFRSEASGLGGSSRSRRATTHGRRSTNGILRVHGQGSLICVLGRTASGVRICRECRRSVQGIVPSETNIVSRTRPTIYIISEKSRFFHSSFFGLVVMSFSCLIPASEIERWLAVRCPGAGKQCRRRARVHRGASGVLTHVRFACDSSTASAMSWAFRPS